MGKKISAKRLLCALMLACMLLSGQPSHAENLTGPGFSIHIPTGWSPMNGDAMAHLCARTDDTMTWTTAYSVQDSATAPIPYVVVERYEVCSVMASNIDDLKRFAREVVVGAGGHRNELSASYDAEKKIFTIVTSLHSGAQALHEVWSFMYLKNGWVQMNGLSFPEDETSLSQMKAMSLSFQPEPGMEVPEY